MAANGSAKRRRERALANRRKERQQARLARKARKKARVSDDGANGKRAVQIDELYGDPNEPITDRERRLAALPPDAPSSPSEGGARKGLAKRLGKEA